MISGYPGSNEVNPLVNFISTDIGDSSWVCLTATNFNGCTDVYCEPVTIEDAFTIYVPNAFTPDNDEFNQGFGPVFPEGYDIRNYELFIFDRWGEILFESHNPEIGWDGSYAGKTAQDGVYTWKINVRDGNTNKKYSFIGHLSLLR
jgi:gliding motility-associated-like protein